MTRSPGEPRFSLPAARAGLLGALIGAAVAMVAAMLMLIPAHSSAQVALWGVLAAVLGSTAALIAAIRRDEKA